jgi:hypothetical protein
VGSHSIAAYGVRQAPFVELGDNDCSVVKPKFSGESNTPIQSFCADEE